MFESLKISDQRMAKLYRAVFIHKQPLEGFQTLVLPPLASLSPPCRADFQVAASSRNMETKGKELHFVLFTSFLTISKRKKIFIFIFKLAENSPAVGVMKFALRPALGG